MRRSPCSTSPRPRRAPHDHARDCHSPVGDEARRRFQLIVPHVRRAVTIARTLERCGLAEVVDALAAGVLYLADDGYIVRANARALLKAGEDRARRTRQAHRRGGEGAGRSSLQPAGASATIGDPFNLSGTPGSVLSFNGAAAVPEPSVVVLTGLGVAAPSRRMRSRR